jgi:hypothetical protein
MPSGSGCVAAPGCWPTRRSDAGNGLVSYGGVAAGTRAAQQIKQVVTALRMLPQFEAVSIPFVANFLDDDGRIKPNETMVQAAKVMLDELVRVEAALRALRRQS